MRSIQKIQKVPKVQKLVPRSLPKRLRRRQNAGSRDVPAGAQHGYSSWGAFVGGLDEDLMEEFASISRGRFAERSATTSVTPRRRAS